MVIFTEFLRTVFISIYYASRESTLHGDFSHVLKSSCHGDATANNHENYAFYANSCKNSARTEFSTYFVNRDINRRAFVRQQVVQLIRVKLSVFLFLFLFFFFIFMATARCVLLATAFFFQPIAFCCYTIG